MPRILVVDDDRDTCRFMRELLEEPEHEVETAQTPDEALALLEAARFELVVSDINLNAELTGLDLLRAFKARDPEVEVVLISAFGTLETALEAVKAGAFDYVSKPVDIGQVREVVARALARRARAAEPRPAVFPAGRAAPDGLVGRSGSMLAVYKQIALACGSDAPVLVTGETGTGKELLARAIHKWSRRAAGPFVSVSCAAIPDSLIASELFGHERGAFTGALQRRLGRFELAAGGTLFLDEVGELPPETQVALLRVLQEREFVRVGGTTMLHADVRIVAATNRDLEQAIMDGAFRSDLYYRLDVFPLHLPPLRERVGDIRPLVEHLVERYARTAGRVIRGICPRTLELLEAYPWPGNVRELQNVVERSFIECESDLFSVDTSWLRVGPTLGDPPDASPSPVGVASRPTRHSPGTATLDEIERDAILATLHARNWIIGGPHGAAAVLGLKRTTLQARMKKLGIASRRPFPAGSGSGAKWRAGIGDSVGPSAETLAP